MLAVYLEGSNTPLPGSVLTVNGNGLDQRAAAVPGKQLGAVAAHRAIEIAIAAGMFDGFVLDATPTPLSTGPM